MNASSQVLCAPNDDFCLWEVLTEHVCERYRGTISGDLRLFVVGFPERLACCGVCGAICFCYEAVARMAIADGDLCMPGCD
jgi:hypothetical protein